MRRYTIIILALSVLMLFGCEYWGTAPRITDVFIMNMFGGIISTANSGDELHIMIYTTDQDCNICYLVAMFYQDGIFKYDSDTTLFPYANTHATYSIYTIINETGDWCIDFRLRDLKGEYSNTYRKCITII